MRNLLSSFLLTWLASINVGISSPTQTTDSLITADQPSTGRQDLKMTDSRASSVQNYAPTGEMVIPRLRHRLRKDISTRLGTRGILFDKTERSRSRRRHSRPLPFFAEYPFQYERRQPFSLRPPYNSYADRFDVEQYDEFPDNFEAFLMNPFSPFYYQSPEPSARPSPSYYQRPQSYNRPTAPTAQPFYNSGQFMRPQQVESVQARPYYYPGQNLVSNRRPSREQPDQEFTFEPPQIRPAYYRGQALPSNSQFSSLDYNNRPTTSVNTPTQLVPTSTGQGSRRQPLESALQQQPAGPGAYADKSNVQLLRPNIQGRPSVPTSTAPVDSERPLQSAFQQQLQTRPNYRNESDVQSPELNPQGLRLPLPTSNSEVNNEQPSQSKFERQQVRPDNRNESNVQRQALNAVRQSAPTSASRENNEQTTDSKYYQHDKAAVPDYDVDSNEHNTEPQPVWMTSEAEGSRQQHTLDQDAILGVPQKKRAQSDQHDEIQSQHATPETDESKIGQPLSVAGPVPQKSSKER